MHIRKATSKDIDALTGLKQPRKATHKQLFYANQIKRLEDIIEHKGLYLVAEESEQILGHVYVRYYGIPTEPDIPNMQDLYVHESKRNHGIGTALIKTAEAEIKKAGYIQVSISVNPTLNPKARALYKRLGYKQTATEPYLDGVYDGDEDWVIDMVKHI